MNKKNIMFLGTASSVGKSTLVAALCRYLVNDGFSVAPFKALNISLNSYVTKEDLEMGRAQVVQAEACKIEPMAIMNPVLLKPNGNVTQVIVCGKVYKNIQAYKYKELNEELKVKVKRAYDKLKRNHEIIVLEGSGSCAEINLRDSDIANMYMAKKVNAPVILVADIDRGGVFASIVGTLQLLKPEEKALVKGVIINKFRGNKEFFKDGIKELESIINIPVLGVIPYETFNIEEEDSVSDKIKNEEKEGVLDIAIIRLSHMSNFTDFNVLGNMKDVNIRYINDVNKLNNPDLIIIPGTKNTIEDLRFLKEKHLFEKIKELKEKGTPILGICGGYQMLGKFILDDLGIEGEISEEEGFGFLDIKTRFNESKITKQTNAKIVCDLENIKNISGKDVCGYEIHNGISKIGKKIIPFIKDLNGNIIGVCDEQGLVAGTYLHGLFDSKEFLKAFVASLKESNNIFTDENDSIENNKIIKKDLEYDRLAQIFKDNIDIKKLRKIIGI